MKTKSANVCINLNAIEEFIYFRVEGGDNYLNLVFQYFLSE